MHCAVRRSLAALLAGLLLLAAGCQPRSPTSGPQVNPTLLPATAAPTPVAPLSADTGDTGWEELEPGVHYRRLLAAQGSRQTPVYALRLDPAQVAFRVGYAPDAPRTLRQWCAAETPVDDTPLAVINGGFFQADYRTSALLIQNGTATGSSYVGRGGMFAVDAGGAVSLRYLAEQPYQPDEPLLEALQGWPMLVSPGGRLAYANPTDTEPARRSVLARDEQGHIVLLVAPEQVLTLPGMAAWLLASDLHIEAAINLDGGASTGMCVQSERGQEHIAAYSLLPIVLHVVRR